MENDAVFCSLLSPEDFENALKKYQQMIVLNKNAKFVCVLKKEQLFDENFENLLNLLAKKLENNKISNFSIAFHHNFYNCTVAEKYVQKMEELKEKYPNISVGLEIENEFVSLSRVKKTHKKINEVVKRIQSKRFSQFEQLMYLYFYVTKRIYKLEDKDENFSHSRSIYSIMNGDKIVCAGFSLLMLDCIKKLSSQNMKGFINIVNYDGEHSTCHANLIVYLKDEKYNINGYYLLDPTYDAQTFTNQNSYYLSHFLASIKDLQNFKKPYLAYAIGGKFLGSGCVSVGLNMALTNHAFRQQLASDLICSKFVQNVADSKNITPDELLQNEEFALALLKVRSEVVDSTKMHKAFSVVMEKKLKMYEQSKREDMILSYLENNSERAGIVYKLESKNCFIKQEQKADNDFYTCYQNED